MSAKEMEKVIIRGVDGKEMEITKKEYVMYLQFPPDELFPKGMVFQKGTGRVKSIRQDEEGCTIRSEIDLDVASEFLQDAYEGKSLFHPLKELLGKHDHEKFENEEIVALHQATLEILNKWQRIFGHLEGYGHDLFPDPEM